MPAMPQKGVFIEAERLYLRAHRTVENENTFAGRPFQGRLGVRGRNVECAHRCPAFLWAVYATGHKHSNS